MAVLETLSDQIGDCQSDRARVGTGSAHRSRGCFAADWRLRWTVGPTWDYFRFYLPSLLSSAAATLLLTTLFSSYVSTLCVGGLRALLVALPLSFSLASLYVYLIYAVDRLRHMVITNLYGPRINITDPGG
jgi:hypothetical protein